MRSPTRWASANNSAVLICATGRPRVISVLRENPVRSSTASAAPRSTCAGVFLFARSVPIASIAAGAMSAIQSSSSSRVFPFAPPWTRHHWLPGMAALSHEVPSRSPRHFQSFFFVARIFFTSAWSFASALLRRAGARRIT